MQNSLQLCRFALLGLLQLNLHDSVQLSLFVPFCECAVEFEILIPSSEAPCWCADDAHYCTFLCSWVFNSWLCKVKFRNSVQWIALPGCWRCTPVSQWKKSAKNLKWIICRSKVQGFRTRGHVNQTTPSDQVYPCLSLWWRVEHYMLLIWIEVDIVGSVCLLSLFLLVQETTQEEVVVNPTTPSDQAHPCLFPLMAG